MNNTVITQPLDTADFANLGPVEAALLRHEAEYQVIFDAVPALIFYLDQDTCIQKVNLEACRCLGLPRAAITGKSIYQVFPAEIAKRYAADNLEILRTGKSIYKAVEEFFFSSGQKGWVETEIVPAYDHTGEINGSIVIAKDITEKVNGEYQLRQNEERYRSMYDNSPLAFILSDASGVILDWNIPAERAFGWTRQEAVGSTWAQLFMPSAGNNRGDVEPDFMNELGLHPLVIQSQQAKNGGLVEFEWHNSLIKGQTGEVTAVISLGLDITAKNKTQALLERYRLLAENARDIMLFIRLSDKHILDANEAAAKAYGYTREELTRRTVSDLRDPSTYASLNQQLDQAAREGLSFSTLHIRKNGQSFPVDISAHGVTIGGERVLISVIRDMSEQHQARISLQRQIDENLKHTQELEVITRVSTTMRQARTRAQMIPLLVDQSMQVMSAQAGGLGLLDENALILYGFEGAAEAYNGIKLSQYDDVFWDVIHNDQAVYIEDLHRHTPVKEHHFFSLLTKDLAACLVIPLRNGLAAIGLLFLGFDQPQDFTVNTKKLVTAIAEMAGSALHRMSVAEKLEKMVTDRTQELESIYQITSAASEQIDLNKSLKRALDLTCNAVTPVNGCIFLVDEENSMVDLAAENGLQANEVALIQHQPIDESPVGQVIRQKEALILPNANLQPTSAHEYSFREPFAFMALPMRVHNRVIGVLAVAKPVGNPLNLEELTLLSFIADHLGLVVENTRLFRKAEHTAVLEERSRLARELHDSVTQSLYSATLFAAGAQEYAAHGKLEQVNQILGQLAGITTQALKDMRLMVYELRSPALSTSGLAGALKHRLDMVERRAGIGVKLRCDPEIVLQAQTEEGLYRIALEAFNNSLKHANAAHLTVELKKGEDVVELTIADDGAGFELDHGLNNGGFGLTSMKERVDKLGGWLTFSSKPGQGTTIQVKIPAGN